MLRKSSDDAVSDVIPGVFYHLLDSSVTRDGDNTAAAMHRNIDAQQAVFEYLNPDNANQIFSGLGLPIFSSSQSDRTYSTQITCSFLHIAIQLNRLDIVKKLLFAYKVTIEAKLSYSTKVEIDRSDDHDYFGEKKEEYVRSTGALTVDELAKDKPEIQELLKEARARRHYRPRLILGDGNLSYARALLAKQRKKHPHLGYALMVTDYATKEELAAACQGESTRDNRQNFSKNYKALEKLGARLIFEVDATKLHRRFAGKRITRIHFNCPYVANSGRSAAANKTANREMIASFFASAAQVQQGGDRIYMALARHDTSPQWYEAATYGIALAAKKSGYHLIKKRNFCDAEKGKRYPGYAHIQTGSARSVETARRSHEYIFEKAILGKIYKPSVVEYKESHYGYVNIHEILPPCDTDSDSSVYEYSADEALAVAGVSRGGRASIVEEKAAIPERPKSSLVFSAMAIDATERITLFGHEFVIRECGAGGSCLFNVIRHQLSLGRSPAMLRQELCDWYETDEGRAYLEENGAVGTELRIEKEHDEYTSHIATSIDDYVTQMRNQKTWATEREIAALCRLGDGFRCVVVKNNEAHTVTTYGAGEPVIGVYYLENLHFQALTGPLAAMLEAELAALPAP